MTGYPLDFSTKTTALSSTTPEALLPAALAQLGLGWWERSLDGEATACDRFRETCSLLEASAQPFDGACLWPYSVPVRKYRLDVPWISALAQAQAASVFVRAYMRDREERHAELARAAILPLLRDRSPTVRARLPHGPALEECPTEPSSLILNGWIFAAWGLRDVAVGLGSTDARTMYEDTVACLLATLSRYDAGWWSRYSLYPHRLPDLAKIFYHRLHVDQLEVMGQLTGERDFRSLAGRWRTYDTAPHRAALAVQKAAFVASGYR